MARLKTLGFETQRISATATMDGDGESSSQQGTTALATATPHGGNAYWSSATAFSYNQMSVSTTLGRAYYSRIYIRVPGSPANVCRIKEFAAGATVAAAIRLTTSRTLEVVHNNGATVLGSASGVLSINTWYRVELKCIVPAAGLGTIEGVYAIEEQAPTLIASSTSATTGNTAINTFRFGWTSGTPTQTLLIDDIAINDDQGANQNTYPGPGKNVLLKPISDNARGTGWEQPGTTVDVTTDLFASVDNTPSLGVAHSDVDANNLLYVYNAAIDATTNLDMNCETYTTKGITANDQLNVVQAIMRGGSSSTTDTAGAVSLVSNPNQGAETTFIAFDQGAAGTDPTNWKTVKAATLYNPSVTLGSSPVVRVGKRTAVNRVVMVDLMGVMVEYATLTVQKRGDANIIRSPIFNHISPSRAVYL